MKWKYRPPLFIAALIFSLLLVSFAHAVEVPAMPEHYVVDLADVIDAGIEQRLNGYLQELEQKTGAQMIVLTINSLEGESIEDFSITLAHDKWRLGQAGEDNGVLLTVSVNDPAMGAVKVNTIDLSSRLSGTAFSWTGKYYPEVQVTLEARPRPGS